MAAGTAMLNAGVQRFKDEVAEVAGDNNRFHEGAYGEEDDSFEAAH